MSDLVQFLIGFFANLAVVFIIIQCFYYPKSHRKDYYFTYMLMSISIFLLIFILNDVKFKTGFALGLFAIFSIIRYRTESMPIREMTYLFTVVGISVINAMIGGINWMIIAAANVLLVISIGVSEMIRSRHGSIMTKLIMYDRIDLITAEKRDEMIADLEKRTGLTIKQVEVGHIDFLKDSAMLKVHYVSQGEAYNSVNNKVKFPKPEEDNDDD